jgi:MazG family protein
VPAVNGVRRLLEIMSRLRDPEAGCPWDLEQDFSSIAPYTVEEAYEVDHAIRTGDMAGLREELGDLLLQVVFHAQMAREAGHFDFEAVVDGLCDKLESRHPHVFGTARIDSAEQQRRAWEEMKARERNASDAFAGIPHALPALMRASKLLTRTADSDPVAAASPTAASDAVASALERCRHAAPEAAPAAMGALLFACVRLARARGVDPEQALREAGHAFERAWRQRD